MTIWVNVMNYDVTNRVGKIYAFPLGKRKEKKLP